MAHSYDQRSPLYKTDQIGDDIIRKLQVEINLDYLDRIKKLEEGGGGGDFSYLTAAETTSIFNEVFGM